MYKVDLYVRVRRACMVEGMSNARGGPRVRSAPDTVRKMLEYSVPPGTVDSHRRVALSWTRTTG